MFVHLHARSWFSFLNGGSSPESLVHRARELGQPALALTDVNGVYGAVRFQRACSQAGIKAIIGAEFNYREFPLVLLARNLTGYANLCRLLTTFYMDPERLGNTDQLAGFGEGLICLSGGRRSYLWFLLQKGKRTAAADWLNQLGKVFAGGFYVELVNNLCPGDLGLVRSAYELAAQVHLPTVATNDVRFAEVSAFSRYDLMCCARLGLTIHDPHAERPQNAEAYIKDEASMRALIPFAEAVANGVQIADNCQLNLLRSQVTPPSARLPPAYSAKKYLGALCREGLQQRYGSSQAPGLEASTAADQLQKELEVITDLKLEEFFLVVREVVHEAKIRSIRCAGRGSAANSIVAYLLGITAVDPLRHNLLFERFLHRGRKGTPDIDIDFDSERRDEIIAWMEERFGHEHTAMTATVITFRLRLAVREVVKAFGFPMKLVNAASKVVPPREPGHVREYTEAIDQVLATPLLDLILDMVEGFQDCPRHLGLHNGGMILSRLPLCNFSPVQVSANGVKVVQFDKEDVENMGLIKLDVLGLRMLATLSEATELMARHQGMTVDLDAVPLDDEKVYRYIRTGQTVALFQIESQGQIHLIASHQPETFDDLISEIALFRPGPLQGGMVHPFIRRRRGEEKVAYDHPDLEPILRDTYGVILFQEQILEILHRFAGMSLQDADDFRALMSKNRESGTLEVLRERFLAGALARGVSPKVAGVVLDQVANFVGYGFCRSHAAAFAKTVYQSAWLKFYHPGPYMAAVMQHRPGMYSQQTLEEEAKRLGIGLHLPEINCSGLRFDLEQGEKGWAIRKSLACVKEVSEEVAKRLLWARLEGPFADLEDLFRRVSVPRSALDFLARAGAFDAISGSSRRALWQIGVLSQRAEMSFTARRLGMPLMDAQEIPEFPRLTRRERLLWDLSTHEAGRVHPMAMVRRQLNDFSVQTIGACYRISTVGNSKTRVVVAGTAVLKQRPPTAKGVMFVTLEDETGYIQVVVYPQVQHRDGALMREPALIVEGELQINRGWRGVVAEKVYPLLGVFGGTAGFPSASGGDGIVLETKPEWSRQPRCSERAGRNKPERA